MSLLVLIISLFPVLKSIFLLIFSLLGEIRPKYVLPSLIFLKDSFSNPLQLIFIFKFSSKNKLATIINSNLGALLINSFNFEIISSGTSSLILSSSSIEALFSFDIFFIVWSWVFVRFLSDKDSSISFKGSENSFWLFLAILFCVFSVISLF